MLFISKYYDYRQFLVKFKSFCSKEAFKNFYLFLVMRIIDNAVNEV